MPKISYNHKYQTFVVIDHSANFIILTFVSVSQKYFWPGCFAPPAAPGGGQLPPSAPLPLVTPLHAALQNVSVTLNERNEQTGSRFSFVCG